MFAHRRQIRKIKKLGAESRKQISSIAKADQAAQRKTALAANRPPTRLGRMGKTTGEALAIVEAIAAIATAASTIITVSRALKQKPEPETT